MANDLPIFQLIFNVIAITGLTSLAVICSMLKRDKERLSVELRERHWQAAAPTAHDDDIRRYVGSRMQNWIEIQKAGTKA